MRSIYAQVFKTFGRLPDEIGRQSPFVLFKMLDDLGEEDGTEDEEVMDDPRYRMFYGR